MGKVRSLRARVHQAAVRLTREAAPGPAPPAREAAPPQASAGGVGGKEWAFPSASVFAGTTIDPGALVQKLDEDVRSRASTRRGVETKAVLPKKEKLKLRRERWLHKIEAIKLAEQKRKAERRRQATVVVGDLQPLRDALPELLELEAGGRRLPARRGAASRPRPAELSRMNAAQRLQLLEEERTRFQELLASPAYRASPLLAIGRQLAQQMQLDGSQP
ncbi:protein FAM207A [Camelus ferus]|uniref:Protein FAM207A n=3 Tax=Camelus TaxID=9836 RepID=A0A8B8TYK7_CAMFR|nr:ribosome biogenesis protein SLX9 homolog [Camelus bactrianus]XP_032347372.1 protein FAM207A [Camelus ferus]